MKTRQILILLLGFMVALGLDAAELKIGFVNVPKVLQKASQAEQAMSLLEQEFSPRKKRIVAGQKELKSLKETLTRDAAIMGESERRALERKVLNKEREAKRAQEEFREDLSIRQNEELGKLQKQVFEAIKAIAEKEGYDLLLTDGVVYASDVVDVTSKVQEKLKQMP